MKPRRSIGLAVCVAISTIVSESRADMFCATGTPGVSFALGTQSSSCNVPSVAGRVTVTIVAAGIPSQKVRFALPDPPIGTVVAESWVGIHSGDRETGIEVDLGGCTELGWGVTIGQLDIEISPDEVIACTRWTFSSSEAQDCAGLWRPGIHAQDFFVGGNTPYDCSCSMHSCMTGYPPYDLYPPNGATNVPLDVVLTWNDPNDWPEPPYFQGGCYVYMNSRPECEGGGRWDGSCDESFAPNFLEPGRTYYWYAAWWLPGPTGCNYGFSGRSPLYSFTTEGTLPVTPTTWGRVKVMYSD